MGATHPPYTLAWSGTFSTVQGLPKAMRRVLQQALTDDRDDPAKFMVGMGRLLRYCDIGTQPRRSARKAAAALLAERPNIESCLKLAQETSRTFSRAFRAVRYSERHAWDGNSSASLAIVLARDDLESLWQAVRRGVPAPDALTDRALVEALRDLRGTIDDRVLTADALHDDSLCDLMARELAKLSPDHSSPLLDVLAVSEPVCWWLAVYRTYLDRAAPAK